MSDTVSANPHRGKAFWLDHVQRWQNSGLSKIAYCNQHNLKSSNFYNWSRPVVLQSLSESDAQTLSDKPSPRPEPITFLPLSVESSLQDTGKAYVQRGGTDVSLPTDLEPAQLQMWLAAIHQLHV